MITRMIPALAVALLFNIVLGCATSPQHATVEASVEPHKVATTETAQPSVLLQLTPNVTYSFNSPVRLRVRYNTRPPGGELREACFDAYAIPLAEGGTYTLTLKTTQGEGEQEALLVIKSGAILVRGSSPAVGGSETGTWGEGTKFILESVPQGRDYIYLLDHPGSNHDLKVYRKHEPVVTIPANAIGKVRGFRWLNEGNTNDENNQDFTPMRNINEDARREDIRRRLEELLP